MEQVIKLIFVYSFRMLLIVHLSASANLNIEMTMNKNLLWGGLSLLGGDLCVKELYRNPVSWQG
jgi:hypothetical protein